MGTAAEVMQALGGSSPGWFVASALLLTLTWQVSRRQATSSRSQGIRIGNLEKTLELEVVRRRQVEAELLADGLRLPWWLEDNTPPARQLPDRYDDVTTERRAVPPLPDGPALSRHRR